MRPMLAFCRTFALAHRSRSGSRPFARLRLAARRPAFAGLLARAFAVATLLLASPAAAVPSHIEQNLREILGFSDGDIAELETEPVARSVESEEAARTLTVAAAVRVAAPTAPILEDVAKQRGVIESDALQVAGLFGEPPALEDLAAFSLPAEDLKLLPKCRPQHCKVKLQAAAIEEFQGVDWSAPDAADEANAVARRRILDYVRGYLREGQVALANYADKSEPLSVADGLGKLLARAKYLRRHVPELERHLRSFPRDPTPGVKDVLFWTLRDYGLSPVTGVTHAALYAPETEEGLVGMVLAMQLFSTHYLQARMQVVALFADDQHPEQASWLVIVDRSLFDGELGGLQRGMVRRGLVKDIRRRADSIRQRYGEH